MSANDEQKECGRILSDYATDMVAPNPIDTAIALANAGFGTEAGVILSCVFSSGPKIHLLPRGFTTVAVYKFKLKNEGDEGVIDDMSNDEILAVLGTDITRPPPPGTAPTVTAYCYRLRYASFGKISHVYPCTYEELKKYGDIAFEKFNEELRKYYNTTPSMMQGGAQGSAQQAVTAQQTAPPRRAGLRRRRAEEVEERTEEEEEPEEEVSKDEQ
jgi:hypothetical protein